MWNFFFLLIFGFVFLYIGAEWLVKGASQLAMLLGLSPLLIGLTIVAFGTSTPELVVSLLSALKGKSMIAIGNVVGSNICNIALVLGIASLFHPIKCRKELLKRDIPIMVFVSVYLIVISLDSEIGRFDGFILFLSLITYTIFNYLEDKTNRSIASTEDVYLKNEHKKTKGFVQTFFIIIGILFVVVGAKMVVKGAENIMRIFGISEKVIGLTIVAFGTSLPELATSVVASYRKYADISIGNLIGSNAFNIMCVLGLTALIKPIPITGGIFKSKLFVDYLIMLIISLIPWFMIRRNLLISRKDGLILLTLYTGYILYLYI